MYLIETVGVLLGSCKGEQQQQKESLDYYYLGIK